MLLYNALLRVVNVLLLARASFRCAMGADACNLLFVAWAWRMRSNVRNQNAKPIHVPM